MNEVMEMAGEGASPKGQKPVSPLMAANELRKDFSFDTVERLVEKDRWLRVLIIPTPPNEEKYLALIASKAYSEAVFVYKECKDDEEMTIVAFIPDKVAFTIMQAAEGYVWGEREDDE